MAPLRVPVTDEQLVEMWWLNHVLERVLVDGEALEEELMTAVGHRLRNLQTCTVVHSKAELVVEIRRRGLTEGGNPPEAVRVYLKAIRPKEP
jgi:hypothetical protein